MSVFLTEPAYLGVSSDLAALVECGHAAGLPVLIEQAWGAHFGFQRNYPAHALAAGADALVTSAHKTLLGYSQAALVVARIERLDRDRLDRAFDAGWTTSPAGSILASIDASRALLATAGSSLLDRWPGRWHWPGNGCAPGPAWWCRVRTTSRGVVSTRPNWSSRWPGRVSTASTSGSGCSPPGTRWKWRTGTVVPIVTIADDRADVLRMVDVLGCAISDAAAAGPARMSRSQQWPIAPQRVTPRAAFFADRETVSWDRAAGRVCAEVVAPYPPGVAVLAPGEEITSPVIDRLRELIGHGVRVAYAADPTLDTFQVLRDDA